MNMEAELVVGEVRGYRAWRVNDKNHLVPITLNGSISNNLTPRPSKMYVAQCRRRYTSLAPAHPDGKVPSVECSCGFYAIYGDRGLRTLLPSKHFPGPSTVVGSVLMSGVVIKGATGVMRAEKMRLEAILDWSMDHPSGPTGRRAVTGPRRLRSVASNFGLPLVAPAAFLAQYPLENATRENDAVTLEQLETFQRAAKTMMQMIDFVSAASPMITATMGGAIPVTGRARWWAWGGSRNPLRKNPYTLI